MPDRIRIALIPAYKPGRGFIELLKQAREAGFICVAADDGSGPEYAGIFAEAGKYAEVIKSERNMGKGRAVKSGLERIAEGASRDYTVVTLDCDGQHSVSDALRVCEASERDPEALILGSRRQGKGSPLRSRFGNAVTRGVFRLSTGVGVYDTQTGLRAFSSRLTPLMLSVGGERYEYEMNVLLECSRRGVRIKEIPIKTIYIDNNSDSHFDTVKDSYRVYREILRFSASSLVCFLTDYGLFSLLSLLTGGLSRAASLAVSNVGARLVSASLNYTINRRLVFRDRGGVWKSMAEYALLAGCILAGNTLVLGFLAERLLVDRYLAKILTEILFFFISWFVQHSLIFKREAKGDASGK